MADRIKKHGTNVWFVNSGWTAGSYPDGHRMSLKITRAILNAIHSGELEKAEYVNMPVFNLSVPKVCTGVDSDVLIPKNTWKDAAKYDETVKKLAGKF